MRLRPVPLLLTAGLAGLSGCAHPPPPAPVLPPNPYGYLKPASVCDVPKLHLPATGTASTTMRLDNNGGYCKIDVTRTGGGPFASFLVTKVPLHGSPLLYNYDGQSRITYTPTGGYLGPDHMTVELVPGPGEPRVSLDVSITVTSAPVRSARS